MSSGCAGKSRQHGAERVKGPAFSRNPAWKNKTPGSKARDPEKPRWSRSTASTSRMLFSLQGPHRGARHAEPERPSCSRRVTKGPGATAEPHRAARAQHILDSAIFTPREGSSPGQSARRSARALIPSAAGRPPRASLERRRTQLDWMRRRFRWQDRKRAVPRRERLLARGRLLLEGPCAPVPSLGPRGLRALPLTSGRLGRRAPAGSGGADAGWRGERPLVAAARSGTVLSPVPVPPVSVTWGPLTPHPALGCGPRVPLSHKRCAVTVLG